MELMNIDVYTITHSPVQTVCMHPSNTVAHLKNMLARMAGIPVEHYQMVFGGKILNNDRTLEEYQIGNQSVVYVVLNFCQ